MTKFVNDNKLKAALTAKELLNINLGQSKNFLQSKKIYVDFATRKYLASVKVDEKDATSFKL